MKIRLFDMGNLGIQPLLPCPQATYHSLDLPFRYTQNLLISFFTIDNDWSYTYIELNKTTTQLVMSIAILFKQFIFFLDGVAFSPLKFVPKQNIGFKPTSVQNSTNSLCQVRIFKEAIIGLQVPQLSSHLIHGPLVTKTTMFWGPY